MRPWDLVFGGTVFRNRAGAGPLGPDHAVNL